MDECLGMWREKMFTNACITSCTRPLLMSIWQLMLHAGNITDPKKVERRGRGGREKQVPD